MTTDLNLDPNPPAMIRGIIFFLLQTQGGLQICISLRIYRFAHENCVVKKFNKMFVRLNYGGFGVFDESIDTSPSRI